MIHAEFEFVAQQTADYLNAIADDISKLEPLMHDWVDYYKGTVQPEIFAAHEGAAETGGGGHGHPAWAPLTAAYLDSKRKRESLHASDILQLTGDFRRDLTEGTGHTIEEIITMGDTMQVIFGSSRDYPVWAGAGEGGPRQAMYITPEHARRLSEMAQHFLSEIIVKHRQAVVDRNRI